VGWSGMLQKGTLDSEKERKAFEIIERNAKAQAQLIDDILDVSRIVTGRLRLDLRPVQLHSIITTAVDSIRPLTDSKKIRLTMDLESRPSLVSGDPDRLQQVVWNLLSNAAKFTSAGGRIDLSLHNTNAHIELIVRDTGQGIEPEILPHVFDRFRQADSSKTRRHGGLGLGLAIVQHLVELHGGTVTAKSDGEGKGSEFRIVLPSLESHENSFPHQLAKLRGPEAYSQLVGRRILTIEDDADARQMIEIVLRSQGADVVAVGSVREAIAILDEGKWRPTAIISDLGMPDEDGYDLIKKVRSRSVEDCGQTPAIALTGYAGKEEVERVLNAGYQAHLLKPLDLAQLIRTIISMSPKS
jgi:CheY-like chemotaxis protein/two-component sensor histidine kinase